MKNNIENKYGYYLLTLGEIEQSIEELRKSLNYRRIDTYQIFKFVDLNSQKFLNLNSLIYFFNFYEISYTQEEIEKFIQFYNFNEDGNLIYAEFLNLILPKIEIKVSDQDYNNFNKDKDYLYKLTLNIFKKEIQLCRFLLKDQEILYNSENLYRMIDKMNRGYFTQLELTSFLQSNKIKFAESDVNSIIYRLDVDKDGRVSKKEFITIFSKSNLYKNNNYYEDFEIINKNQLMYGPQYNSKHLISKLELNFLNFIKELIEIEINYENIKCEISLQSDISLHFLFDIFESEGKDSITLSELKNGFNKFNIFPSLEECNLIIKKYDLNKTGVLCFEDFCEIFCPLDNFYRDKLIQRKYSNLLSKNSEILIKQFINSLFIGEEKLELIKKKLNNMNLGIEDIFAKIDRENRKFINDENVILI